MFAWPTPVSIHFLTYTPFSAYTNSLKYDLCSNIIVQMSILPDSVH